MRYHEFFEDAQGDFRQHQTAIHLIDLACQHIGEDQGASVRKLVNGQEVHLAFEGEQLGWPEDLSHMYLILSPPKDGLSGRQGTMPDTGYHFIQIFGFENTRDVTATLDEFVDSVRHRETLLHEIIHFLDSTRNPSMDAQTRPDRAGYYNSPHEYNAYYHQLVSPLMTFLQAAQKNAGNTAVLNKLAKRLHITTDFHSTLQGIANHAASDANVSEFIALLDDKNNRKLLKRLYTLHREVLKYL